MNSDEKNTDIIDAEFCPLASSVYKLSFCGLEIYISL